jgi:murein L,D-transpeptidase YcbB/YkuD
MKITTKSFWQNPDLGKKYYQNLNYNKYSIKEKIKIYQFYWTAWRASENFQFREDIYSLDHVLFERLQN